MLDTPSSIKIAKSLLFRLGQPFFFYQSICFIGTGKKRHGIPKSHFFVWFYGLNFKSCHIKKILSIDLLKKFSI